METSAAGSSMRSRNGYTLIELLVVILIVGLTLGLIAPRLGTTLWGSYLKGSSRRLAGMARYARSQAATMGVAQRLYYDLDKGEYWLEAESEKSKDELGGRSKLLKGVSFGDVITSEDEKAVEGICATSFSPKGRAEGTTIHLMNSRGRRLSLYIDELTGGVKIVEEYDEPR